MASTNDMMAGVLDGIVIGAAIGRAKQNARHAYEEALAAQDDARQANYTADRERRARVLWQNYAARQDETIRLLEDRVKFLETEVGNLKGELIAEQSGRDGLQAIFEAAIRETDSCPHKEHHKFSSRPAARQTMYDGVAKISMNKRLREAMYGPATPKPGT